MTKQAGCVPQHDQSKMPPCEATTTNNNSLHGIRMGLHGTHEVTKWPNDQMGSLSGVILDTTLGLLWDHFVTLGMLSGHFGITLGSL